jgi:hypothetical protein
VGGLMNLCSVARRVPRENRRPRLSFSHHEAVAHLDHESQRHWLDIAEEYRLTRDELRAQISAGPHAALGPSVEPSPVIEDERPQLGRRTRPSPLASAAREILEAPIELDGRTCISADVLARLRSALAEESS